MSIIDVPEIIALIRETGTDNPHIALHPAATGLPENLDETISAFANMPEGGILILGVRADDATCEAVGVWDIRAAQEGLNFTAQKKISPTVQLGDIELAEVEGKVVVSCLIPPQPSDLRPFRTTRNGAVHIRGGEGNYELSENEVQALQHQQGIPTHEREPVRGAELERDLVAELVDRYLAAELENSPRIRSLGREQQLIRTNVLDGETGSPTLAALYAFGVHPQQFLPTLTVKTHALPEENPRQGTPLINPREFNGPVPDLLDQTLAWVATQKPPELPAEAVREAISNALVHRDLSTPSRSLFIQVTWTPGGLSVSSPGGLWGLTVSQLGNAAARARNPILYRMCATITSEAGHPVIGSPSLGVTQMRRSLAEAGLPGPRFLDGVTRFQTLLPTMPRLSAADLDWLRGLPGSETLSAAQRHALVAMREGETISDRSYRREFRVDASTARRELQELLNQGLVLIDALPRDTLAGEPRATVYRLAVDGNPAPGVEKALDAPMMTAAAEKFPVDTPEEEAPAPAAEPSPAAQGGSRRLSQDEKDNLVLEVLRDARDPMSRVEISELTALSLGQLNPTLAELRDRELIEFTEPARSRRQRYRLVRR